MTGMITVDLNAREARATMALLDIFDSVFSDLDLSDDGPLHPATTARYKLKLALSLAGVER